MEGPLDEELSRRRLGMVRELHPAGTREERSTPTRGRALADDPVAKRDGEALPGAETTPSGPPLPGEALPEAETTPPQPLDPGEASL